MYVQLVKNGRINYFETTADQAQRSQQTWDTYTHVEYGPGVMAVMGARTAERDRIRERLII